MRPIELLSPRGMARRFSPSLPGDPEKDRLAEGSGRRGPGTALRKAEPLGRLGDLEVRLAASAVEVRRAQALRYQVFFREMAAIPDARTRHFRRDIDRFDAFCDHLLVIDRGKLRRPWLGQRPEIVGTYRLLRQQIAERHGGFYTDREFDIAPLLKTYRDLRFLELGRSCVVERHRTKRTVELLWRGIWAYAQAHRVDVMIGCASLQGTDPDGLALPLSFLHHTARVPAEWHVRAHDHLRVDMNRLPQAEVDTKEALRSLPPLLKGYLRLGAFIADGAVVDRQFGTTDVCVILPVARIGARYLEYFGSSGARGAG